MKNINTLDITKRCGYKPDNIVYDFLKKMTDDLFQKELLELVTWYSEFKPGTFKDTADTFKPYLNSKISEVPEEILDRHSHHWYTDGENYYLYEPCCK